MRGEVHGPYEPTAPPGPSKRHSNVEGLSELVKVIVVLLTLIGPFAPPVTVVSGAVVSTVNDAVAGDASGVPRLSVARTENVYDPSASELYAFGDVHAAYVPVVEPGPSSLHWNVDPGLVEPNPNDGDALFVAPVGPLVIEVSGAEVSTVNARVAGVASTLPAPSAARTENAYEPSASGPTIRGEVQLTYVPVAPPGPSSLHSNAEPGSELENPNDGDAWFVVPDGPESIVVSGAAVSTVKGCVAGDASTLPAGSVARTENV
jgi:hypothetical protein